jgi:hypothetical protein
MVEVAKGHSTRAIAVWLKATHAIDVSHVAVGKLLRKHRAVRAESAKATIVEYTSRKLPADLERADDHYDRIAGLLDAALSQAEGDLTSFAVDNVRKLHECMLRADEQKRKALGLDQPESPAITSLFDLLSGDDESDASGPN